MNEKELKTALFRFSLISPLIHLKDGEEKKELIKGVLEREYEVPFSKKVKLSEKTLLRYLKSYKKNGFNSLARKERIDKNKGRALSTELVEALISLKKQEPRRSVKKLIELIRLEPKYREIKLAERTISKLLKREGFSRKDFKPKKIYRSFEMESVNELWEADIMDGLFIKKEGKKTYLFAFIDDYSRLVTHGQFYFDEKLPRLEDCLKKAILKRGIPKAIYADNGKVYVSNHLKRICA